MTHATLKSIASLRARGLIAPEQAETLARVEQRYAVAISPHVQRHVSLQRPSSPLARQFVPDVRELDTKVFELTDPIGDARHAPTKGVVHRYPNRVLLKPVSVCPVYCRFCFRREMVGPQSDGLLTRPELDAAFHYIARHSEIEEVILTGGDPLILSPRRIAQLTERLSDIPHVRRLRWHSRVPVVAPERVTADLVDALACSTCSVRIAVHANHGWEFDKDSRAACVALRQAGITLLSQTVLLAGINDTTDALADLFHVFADVGLHPYYLHQLDAAPGTHHFRVSMRHGKALLRAVRQRAAPATVPRYMLDIPGGYGKINIEDGRRLRSIGHDEHGDLYRLQDPFGRIHIYCDPYPGAGRSRD